MLFLTWLTSFSSAAHSCQRPTTVYHAFNQRFHEVKGKLDSLASVYDGVQISPAQKSIGGHQWWGRYQPVDHCVIDGLGSKEELADLCRHAKDKGIRIIADVVFNHMSVIAHRGDWQRAQRDQRFNEELLHRLDTHFPGLTRDDFHPWKDMMGDDWDNENRFEGWGAGEWSDLKPTEKVLLRHQKHIDMLLEAGVTGFRFDAAKHIRPRTLRAYVDYIRQICKDAYIYLEVLSPDPEQHAPFLGWADTTDFQFCFDLRNALHQQVFREPPAVPDREDSVLFVRNHDTIQNHDFAQSHGYSPSDPKLSLAWVMLLAHPKGTVLVYPEDEGLHKDGKEPVRAALQFRREMQRRHAPPGTVVSVNETLPSSAQHGAAVLRSGEAMPQEGEGVKQAAELERLAGATEMQSVRRMMLAMAEKCRKESHGQQSPRRASFWHRQKKEENQELGRLVVVLRGEEGAAVCNFGHKWCNASLVEEATRGVLKGSYRETIYGFDVEFDAKGKVVSWGGAAPKEQCVGPQSSLLLLKHSKKKIIV